MIVRAGDFLEKRFHVHDLEIVDAVSTGAHDAEIRVAQHDGIGRAPFVAGEEARVDEIHVRLERRFEAVLPALERGKDRDVVGGEIVFARANVSPNWPR